MLQALLGSCKGEDEMLQGELCVYADRLTKKSFKTAAAAQEALPHPKVEALPHPKGVKRKHDAGA